MYVAFHWFHKEVEIYFVVLPSLLFFFFVCLQRTETNCDEKFDDLCLLNLAHQQREDTRPEILVEFYFLLRLGP